MLYVNGTIVTMNKKREILKDDAVLVEELLIREVGKTTELVAFHPEVYLWFGKQGCNPRIDRYSRTSCSGFTAESGDECGLIQWLCQAVWVLPGQMTTEEAYDSARLCVAEIVSTTCFLQVRCADHYGFDGIAKAVESNIRGCLSKIVMDVGKYASQDAWSMHL